MTSSGRRVSLSTLVGLVAMTVTPATALAHSGHATHGTRGISALSLTVFGAGTLVFLTGLYLDGRDDVDDAYGTAGLFIGLAGVLAALALVLF